MKKRIFGKTLFVVANAYFGLLESNGETRKNTKMSTTGANNQGFSRKCFMKKYHLNVHYSIGMGM